MGDICLSRLQFGDSASESRVPVVKCQTVTTDGVVGHISEHNSIVVFLENIISVQLIIVLAESSVSGKGISLCTAINFTF